MTRHLADFLRGRPRIEAILFNGGSLRPELLRERICQQVTKWQGGLPPLALENADPELLSRAARRNLENSFTTEQNASRRAPRARCYSK